MSGLLAVALFVVLAAGTVAGILLSHILWPTKTPATVDVSLLMGHPSIVTFSVLQNSSRTGWFFPGLRGAPTVVLCHGYESQRGDILTLVTALQEHQYNAFLFDFSGHGTSPGTTSLGYRESGELRAAINALAQRDDVDRSRFGLWGTDLGAYAAMSVATSDVRIRAIAVDSIYDDPQDFLRLQVDRSGLEILPLVTRFSELGFRLLNYRYRNVPPLSTHMARLRGVAQLYIVSEDRSQLANSTQRMFLASPEPHSEQVDRVGYSAMSDEDRRNYESLVVSFFLQSLPIVPSAER